MVTHIVLAVTTFAVTNMDDLLILSLYFANPAYKTKNIILGQYSGILVLIGISLSGFFLGKFLDEKWISLLGLVPLVIGIKELIILAKHSNTTVISEDILQTKTTFQFVSVAVITIANGGDNIGVYTPLFATVSPVLLVMYISIFLLLTSLWCFLGHFFVNHPVTRGMFARYGKAVMPFFLILLGLFIMKDFFFSVL